ncbi:MAG: cobalt-precorrin-6A reductase [Phormidesmis sp.]
MIKPQVWLIGGTCESAELAKALEAQGLPYVVTVTTSNASALYPSSAVVCVGAMTSADIKNFIQQRHVQCILDASHPFACEISRQAMAIASDSAKADSLQPTYIRYERSAIEDRFAADQPDRNVITVDSFETLLSSNLLQHQRVLFTLGYRHLSRFTDCRRTSKLFARVLPSVEAIAGAQAAGFSPTEIIALRPPISAALETALCQQWEISCVVAKASGSPGGEATKRQVAKSLDINLILIKRPPITYSNQTGSMDKAIDFCAKTLSLY